MVNASEMDYTMLKKSDTKGSIQLVSFPDYGKGKIIDT